MAAKTAGFRNILALKYAEIDVAKVYGYLKKLGDFSFFAKRVSKALSKRP